MDTATKMFLASSKGQLDDRLKRQGTLHAAKIYIFYWRSGPNKFLALLVRHTTTLSHFVYFYLILANPCIIYVPLLYLLACYG
jgi:hypothetical protein